MRTIDNINNLNKADFLLIFGNVFEKTESVALEAFKSKPFKDFDDIILKMLNIYESYPKDKILEILIIFVISKIFSVFKGPIYFLIIFDLLFTRKVSGTP